MNAKVIAVFLISDEKPRYIKEFQDIIEFPYPRFSLTPDLEYAQQFSDDDAVLIAMKMRDAMARYVIYRDYAPVSDVFCQTLGFAILNVKSQQIKTADNLLTDFEG